MSKPIKIVFVSILATLVLLLAVPVIQIISFWSVVASLDDRAGKDNIINYVKENRQELETAIAELVYDKPGAEGDITERIHIPEFDGIKYVTLYRTERFCRWNEDRVDFDCGGYGLGSETGYEGFLYLLSGIEIETDPQTGFVDMTPLGFHYADNGRFKPEGNGWRWKEEHGDNTVYVEHIEGEFYYYIKEF